MNEPLKPLKPHEKWKDEAILYGFLLAMASLGFAEWQNSLGAGVFLFFYSICVSFSVTDWTRKPGGS